MDEWIFVALLHNLPVKTSVGNRYIAVVSPTDPRVEALRCRSSAFCQFVDGFKDIAAKLIRYPFDLAGHAA